MSFFTDTSSAPRINDNKTFRKQTTTSVIFGSPTFQRTVTTEQYRHVCLTEAAADSIAKAKNDRFTTATSNRMNAAGMYQVIVRHDTYGAWSS